MHSTYGSTVTLQYSVIYVKQQTSLVVITIPSYVLYEIRLVHNLIGEQANERLTSSRRYGWQFQDLFIVELSRYILTTGSESLFPNRLLERKICIQDCKAEVVISTQMVYQT